MLLGVALAAGRPGGRLRRIQRFRQTRRQLEVSGFIHHRVLQQQAAARPDAPRGLPEGPHQLFEHGFFVGQGTPLLPHGLIIPAARCRRRNGRGPRLSDRGPLL